MIGPGEEVVHPGLSRRLDPETELVLVIGRTARHVAAADAWDFIGGYTCGNDVTARDIQKSDGQWTRGKGFGDVIFTGTPEGVRPVEPGNTSTVEVEGLGSLSNPVVTESHAGTR